MLLERVAPLPPPLPEGGAAAGGFSGALQRLLGGGFGAKHQPQRDPTMALLVGLERVLMTLCANPRVFEHPNVRVFFECDRHAAAQAPPPLATPPSGGAGGGGAAGGGATSGSGSARRKKWRL